MSESTIYVASLFLKTTCVLVLLAEILKWFFRK